MKQQHYKYPRTFHLPWSDGCQSNDKMLESTNHFRGRNVVVTEKMDGENTSMYNDHIHARSIDSSFHWSRTWVKDFWASIKHNIPDGIRLCGENMFAVHSIVYTSLPSYFLLFSVWAEETCLSWEDTKYFAEDLGVELAPILYEGEYDEDYLKSLAKDMDTDKHEGYVVRLSDTFQYSDFGLSVAKFVRSEHIQTDEHWMRTGNEMNMLKVKKH